jgi:hypothetical protein
MSAEYKAGEWLQWLSHKNGNDGAEKARSDTIEVNGT